MIGWVLALLRGLVAIALPSVVQTLVGLGIGFASYTGLKALIDMAKQQVISNLAGLPADAVSLLAVMRVDSAISLTFSALVIRLFLSGMSQSGALTRWFTKGPPASGGGS